MIPLIILAIENDSDREFMISLYVELYPLMKATAHKVIKDASAAEDIVHDTITMLIRNLGTIRDYERKRLVSYIVAAVRNHSINYYNRRTKERGHTSYGIEDDLAEVIPDTSHSPSGRIELLEEYEALGMAMKLLPEKERDILYLKYNIELDDEKIGEIMGIKKDSVRQYLTRARRNARNLMQKGGVTIE